MREESKKEDIMLNEFLDGLYDDLILLTNNDKKYMLEILEHCGNRSGFFELVSEHIEHLENVNKHNHIFVTPTTMVIIGILIFTLFCIVFSEIILNCSLVNC